MKTTKPRSLFRWAGSKVRMMPRLIPLMPKHNCYVSLFGGSAADILYKPKSKVEIYNDLDTDVVNVFRVLRSDEQRKTLRRQLELTPYSRLQYAECLAIQRSAEADPVKRAWAFMYCTMTYVSGADPGICSNGSFGVPKTHGIRSDWRSVGERIEYVARRLREVVIENKSWEEILRRYDQPGVFFYADPPYLLSTRTGRLYTHEMTVEQHAALVDALRRVKGFVMLSGYHNDLYRERLGDWCRVEFKVLCSMSTANIKPSRTEVVWLNYGMDGKRCAG